MTLSFYKSMGNKKLLRAIPVLLFCGMTFQASAIIEITGIVNCYSQYTCDGKIDVTAEGNAGPFVIKWGNGANQSVSDINGSYTIANLCPNTNYSITVTNQYGCPKILGAYIGLCDTYPEYTITPNAIAHSTFPGAAEGSIDISVSVTGSPYTPLLYYKWTDQSGRVIANSQDLSHLNAGLYCVEVTSGCQKASRCFEVKDCSCPCPVGIEFDMNFKCSPGVDKGSLGVKVSSEFPPFTYQWSGPDGFSATAPKLYSIGEGNYCVTVTDKCGRTASKCQDIRCCDPYELPTIRTAYECFYWEDVFGINHEHDGDMEVLLSPAHYSRAPECNAQFQIKWSVDNSENTVSFNTVTNSWEGTTLKHIQSPGIYCVTVTNSCGCTRKSCRAFGQMGHYSGFEWSRLGEFLDQNVPGYSSEDFYDEEYPVLTKCFQCYACGMDRQTNVVGMNCDQAEGSFFDFFTYADPNPNDDKPCSGGQVNCYNNPPNAFSPWTIPEGLEGIEIVDRGSPPETIVVDGQTKCVYPTWCLFPPGSIDNFPVQMPVLVKHPVGKIVPPGQTGACNPSAPTGTECPFPGFLTNDGIGEDCILRWYCSNTKEVIEIDNSFQSFITICECAIDLGYCATVRRCELNASTLGDPVLCGGFEILVNNCEGPNFGCGPVPRPSPSGRLKTQSTEREETRGENAGLGIRVYPNPFTGDVRIDFDNNAQQNLENIQVEIKDLAGRLLATFQSGSRDKIFVMELSLDNERVPQGMYMLSIKIADAPFGNFLIIKPW